MTGALPRVAYLDLVPPDARRHVTAIAGAECEVVWPESDDPAEILRVVRGARSIIVGHLTAHADVLDGAGPDLRLIVRLGRGVEMLDLAAASRLGLDVIKTTGGNASQVAEHVILLMLALLRRLDVCFEMFRDGLWDRAGVRHELRGLSGRTVLLIGSGQVGRATTRLLESFGARVEVVSRGPGGSISRTALESAVARAEIISIHVPLVDETRHLVDDGILRRMRPDALLINTSRGSVVDELALIEALQEGRIAGAGLDVFSREPLPAESPLRSLPNVILTPHIAGSSKDTQRAVAEQGIRSLLAHHRGRELPAEDWILRAGQPPAPPPQN